MFYDAQPSILVLILTNKQRLLFNVTNFTCSIRDWHDMLCIIKSKAPPPNKRKMCPSYTNFVEMVSCEAVGVLPVHVACVFDDVEWRTSTGLMKSS